MGKSSLLNWLLEEERAIVTDIPGTTRDTVEEYVNIEGIPMKIVDTAGIHETGDLVEKIGVEKSKNYAEKADLLLILLDASCPLEQEDRQILAFAQNKKAIILLNKIDLEQKITEDMFQGENIISISVKKNIGFDKLIQQLKKLFFEGEIHAEYGILGNVRHKNALYQIGRASCRERVSA